MKTWADVPSLDPSSRLSYKRPSWQTEVLFIILPPTLHHCYLWNYSHAIPRSLVPVQLIRSLHRFIADEAEELDEEDLSLIEENLGIRLQRVSIEGWSQFS